MQTSMSLKGISTDSSYWQNHGFAGIQNRAIGYADCVIIRSVHWPASNSGMFYLAKPYCDAVRNWGGNDFYFSDLNGDG